MSVTELLRRIVANVLGRFVYDWLKNLFKDSKQPHAIAAGAFDN